MIRAVPSRPTLRSPSGASPGFALAATLVAPWLASVALVTPAVAQIGDPFGKETYPRSMALANELAVTVPTTAWETKLDGEAADLIEFIGDDLLLVGVVEVDRNSAPKHGRLYLYDLAAGERLWRTGRRDMGTGGYDLLATEPWILLRGSDGEEARLSALDLDSGDREWELEMDEPASLAVLPDGERMLLLDRRDDAARLRAVRIQDGEEAWSTPVPEALADETTPVSLVVTPERVLFVGRGVTEVDPASGSLGASIDATPLAEDGGSVLVLGNELLVFDGGSVALVDPAAGAVRWSREAGATIQTVSSVDGDVLVVAGPEEDSKLVRLAAPDGAEVWSWVAGGLLTGPVAAAEGMVIVPTESALVGLDASTGAELFRTALPEDAVVGSPSHAELVGMPDVVRVEGGAVYLARERAGLLSFRLPAGELNWFRGHHEPAGSTGRYTGEGRFATIFEAQLMQSGALPEAIEPPAGLGIGSGSSSLLASAQRDYESARSRYDALTTNASSSDRAGAAADVRMAAELGIAATRIDVAMGQMSAGIGFARSIVSLRDAIRSYNIARGRQGLVDRTELSMRSTLLMQQRLFQSGLYVRPFLMAGKGRGVSLVRLDSGLRADPVFSPVNGPSAGYGLDLGTIRVSASGRRMAMVGISLDTERWERRDKWNTHVPPMSLLTYRMSDLEFGEEARYPYRLAEVLLEGVETVSQALAAGADPDGTPAERPLQMAVILGRQDLVRVLLEAGADPNAVDATGSIAIQQTLDPEMREILLAGGSDEPAVGGMNLQAWTSPLFTSVSAQNPEMIRQAIADGADPNMSVGDGQSILYVAVALDNPELVRLLMELGASTEWEDENGDSPLDTARSDAVREVLRGGG